MLQVFMCYSLALVGRGASKSEVMAFRCVQHKKIPPKASCLNSVCLSPVHSASVSQLAVCYFVWMFLNVPYLLSD